jgi:uncharacterized protein (DUF608 family)
MPLGGIGTGTVSLGGRGDLRDFEIVNRPAKGFTPGNTFFALRAETDEGGAVTRLLEGPLPDFLFEGATGSPARNHGLPRFRSCAFEAAYPLGHVLLTDPDVPLEIAIEAFNPLIPTDADRSGIPTAILRFVLKNPSSKPVRAAVSGSLENFIGDDGTNRLARGNRNEFRTSSAGVSGGLLFHAGADVPTNAESWGTIALAVMGPGGEDEALTVSSRTVWARRSWGDSLLDFWDDFASDGLLEERDDASLHEPAPRVDRPVASLAAAVEVPAGGTRSVTFLLCWHFPNRLTWTPKGHPGGVWKEGGACAVGPPVIGNHYTTLYSDAWDVAEKTAADLPALEAETVAFVRAFCDADLPHAVKEAALFNASTLRTQTCFRTPDGRLFGWEGCHDADGSCLGSCTHVWNYEQTTAFLFGGLSRSMREVEFEFATDLERGHMRFRVPLPLEISDGGGMAAADGQMGCLMKLYRDWKLCGNDDWLRGLWPAAKKALEFCWVPGGWDADRDGVMEGCQHNTMDVEYYGPNPQMGTWYLGALRACEEMARHLGEPEFADECRRLFENGSAWIDAHLFNGEYYEHLVQPPASPDAIAPGLRSAMGAQDLSDPELQLGAGCLVDQLVGQYMAHVCGLGYLLKPENIRATLAALMRHNFRPHLWDHFNHLRTFALADEAAMLMASYPRGRRPARPFPYYNEVMTGFEHTAAAHLLYEGMDEDGLRVVSAVRARYDGRRRSPFDEAECGHHYARAMAAWTHVLALTGFRYDAHTGTMRFRRAATRCRWFWSAGDAWGTICQEPTPDETKVELRVLGGSVFLRSIALTPVAVAAVPGGVMTEIADGPRRWEAACVIRLTLPRDDRVLPELRWPSN